MFHFFQTILKEQKKQMLSEIDPLYSSSKVYIESEIGT